MRILQPHPSMDELYAHAQLGHLPPGAAVMGEQATRVHASPERVWGVITDHSNWSTIDPAFSNVHLPAGVEHGAPIDITVEGFRARGRIAVAGHYPARGEAPARHELTWVTYSLGTAAIDRHVITTLPDGGTLLRVEEGLYAPKLPFRLGERILRLIFPEQRLARRQQTWLTAFAEAAEGSRGTS